MHGVIFGQLKKYVEARLGTQAWPALLQRADLGTKLYLAVETYADEEAVRLVVAASAMTGKSAALLLEDFGEFMVPDLMSVYGNLARPGWKTLEFLENTEKTIHRVVRLRTPKSAPPEIHSVRSAAHEVTITYASQRRMCALARGLIFGVARHYGEDIDVSEPACMLRGDPACKLVVQLR
jgi:hypothetical protein